MFLWFEHVFSRQHSKEAEEHDDRQERESDQRGPHAEADGSGRDDIGSCTNESCCSGTTSPGCQTERAVEVRETEEAELTTTAGQ